MAALSGCIYFVTFDALYTIMKPRLPIAVQYSEEFILAGLRHDQDAVERSFKDAYKYAKAASTPMSIVTDSGQKTFWNSVIYRTATGAGADVKATERALPRLVPSLINRFATARGYELYEDAKPSIERLHELHIQTGLVSNAADNGLFSALYHLDSDLLDLLNPLIFSHRVGVEKPNPIIFERALEEAGVKPHETVHIGDELECDYRGAQGAHIEPLLLRRRGKENAAAHVETKEENLKGITVMRSLTEAAEWVIDHNRS